MAGLASDYAAFRSETDRLLTLLQSTGILGPAHQKVIAEVVLLRLSILIENHLKLVTCRILCGSNYLDGTAPILLLPAFKNIPTAVQGMKIIGRPRPRNLPWNDGSEIRENIRFAVNASDPSFTVLVNYASYLSEVRAIRNHIAHKNDGSRRKYRNVIRRYYGAGVRGVTCGTLLLSPRVSIPPLLELLIRRGRVLMKDFARA